MPALPDRTDWLDPETEEVEEASEPVNIDFEVSGICDVWGPSREALVDSADR